MFTGLKQLVQAALLKKATKAMNDKLHNRPTSLSTAYAIWLYSHLLFPVSYLHYHVDDDMYVQSAMRRHRRVFFLFQNYSKNFKNANELTMQRRSCFLSFSFLLPRHPRYPFSFHFETKQTRRGLRVYFLFFFIHMQSAVGIEWLEFHFELMFLKK